MNLRPRVCHECVRFASGHVYLIVCIFIGANGELRSTNLSEEQLLRDEQIAVFQQILSQQVQDNSNMQNVVISLQQEKEDRRYESENVSTMIRELVGRNVAVDGASMAPLRVEDVTALIRGSPSSPVMLTIAPASLEAGAIDGQDNGNRNDGGISALLREDMSQVFTLWRCERGCGYKSIMFADVGARKDMPIPGVRCEESERQQEA